jgi:hypothetical protein
MQEVAQLTWALRLRKVTFSLENFRKNRAHVFKLARYETSDILKRRLKYVPEIRYPHTNSNGSLLRANCLAT